MPGQTLFFTVALADPSSNLLVREVDVLRHVVRQTLRIRPFQIDAWVVLPNHMHCVWTLPAGDADPMPRWRMITRRFSNSVALKDRDFSRAYRHGIFSDRLRQHVITEQADWERCVQFCWNDPVKHGLVADPRDWPFSSLHRGRSQARAAG